MSIKTVCEANGIKINDRRKVSMGGATKRSKSRVTHIARHHSGVNVDQSMSILEGFWKNTHGWTTGGYHVVIHFDGSVDWNYDYDVTSNGVGNHNSYIFNISVLGNGKFTAAQEKSFAIVAKEVQRELGIPTKNVWGHKEFSGHATNSCPGINMNTVRAALDAGRPAGATNPVISKPVQVPAASGKLVVDGWMGEATTRALQKYFGTPVDGIISQPSMMVKELQKYIGAKVDGYFGEDSIRALQKFFGTPVDGILSEPSLVIKELQTRLNAGNLGKAKVAATPKPAAKPAAPKPASKPKANIGVDGLWGAGTTKALQVALGTVADGVISGQGKNSITQNMSGVKFGDGGSLVIKALQKKIGAGQDGKMGPGTFKALQKYLGTTQDGIMSKPSMAVKELQRRLNAGTF